MSQNKVCVWFILLASCKFWIKHFYVLPWRCGNIVCDMFLRFIVRDFVYSEEEVLAGKNELSKLESDKKKQFVSLLIWAAILPINRRIYLTPQPQEDIQSYENSLLISESKQSLGDLWCRQLAVSC